MQISLKKAFKKDFEFTPDTCTCLKCYHCGGGALHSCSQFNASKADTQFEVECGADELVCRKGWLKGARAGEEDLVRSCSRVPVDGCLHQGSGGSCTCTTDLCNEASRMEIGLLFLLPFIQTLF